jgi:hypothetical protein
MCIQFVVTEAGHIATDIGDDALGIDWAFFAPDGSLLSWFRVNTAAGMEAFGDAVATILPDRAVSTALEVWQSSGAHSVYALNVTPNWLVQSYGDRSVLPPPLSGGVFAIAESYGQIEPYWRVIVRFFDTHGAICPTPWIAAAVTGTTEAMPQPYVAVDDQLHVLVFFPWDAAFNGLFGGVQRARWFTLDGTPLTDEFAAPVGFSDCGQVPCSWQGLVPLVGGGLAWHEGYQWRGVFPSAQPRVDPAPDWLVAMNGHKLTRVGSQGYAFVPVTDAPLLAFASQCADRIEFVAADGTHCATMSLADGLSCPRAATIGRDGSVVQWTYLVPDAQRCQVAIWDRLVPVDR